MDFLEELFKISNRKYQKSGGVFHDKDHKDDDHDDDDECNVHAMSPSHWGWGRRPLPIGA